MTAGLLEIQQSLLGAFFEESLDSIERLESGLLSLSGSEAPASVINDVFRAAHSIKGGAGSFGLHRVSELAHCMETILDKLRAGSLSLEPATKALLLEGVDALRQMLEAARDGQDPAAHDVERLCEQLARAASVAHDVAPVREPAPVERGPGRFQILFAPLPHLFESGNEPVRIFRELARLGKLSVRAELGRLPELAALDPNRPYISWQLELEGDASLAQVQDVFAWIEGDATLEIQQHSAQAPQIVAHPAAEGAPGKPRPEKDGLGSIRVAVEKLDMLMNMVGELVITQSMLGELDGSVPVAGARLEQLREGLSLLARNTRALQESVMRLRSMPISVVFSRFPRLVHDLGRQLGKQVTLKVTGQTTELDKTVIEKLGDPLVHLVRNSMDHGIELPSVRKAAGKPESGTLELHAYHRGGEIIVEVSDDGKGIDRAKVIERARDRGLLGPDENPSDEAITDLIFAPGFSTASNVSDVSGRGVGMDVVRGNVRALGGDVFLESRPGQGTKTTLRLPLTLAIIDGQLVRVGRYTYVIPLLGIVESLQIDGARLSRYQGARTLYRLREQLIPVVDPAPFLGLESSDGEIAGKLMVIVETDSTPIGLVVDELLAQQQVVVKSLESNYGHVVGLTGATILGDGSVALILDAAGMGRRVRGLDATRAA